MNTIRIVGEFCLPKLERLWGDSAREEGPADGEAVGRAILEARQSIAEFDYWNSDSFWICASEVDGRHGG